VERNDFVGAGIEFVAGGVTRGYASDASHLGL